MPPVNWSWILIMTIIIRLKLSERKLRKKLSQEACRLLLLHIYYYKTYFKLPSFVLITVVCFLFSFPLKTIRNDDLEEIRELGSGTYGAVFHGKWKGSDVAIKRIKASCFAGRPSERERLVFIPY